MMQRRLCAAMLLLQSIVLGLTTPVLIAIAHVPTGTALFVGLGLALACLLVAGLLRFPVALWLGWAIQAAALALGLLVTSMFVLAAIFLALWWGAFSLGARIDRERAAWSHAPETR